MEEQDDYTPDAEESAALDTKATASHARPTDEERQHMIHKLVRQQGLSVEEATARIDQHLRSL